MVTHLIVTYNFIIFFMCHAFNFCDKAEKITFVFLFFSLVSCKEYWHAVFIISKKCVLKAHGVRCCWSLLHILTHCLVFCK